MYVTEAFSTYLYHSLAADATTLPAPDEAVEDLTALLASDGSYTWASVRSDATFETVRLHVEGGVLLAERGQAGTTAVAHPCGACVTLVSPTTVAALKSLICEYECCEQGCECVAVESLGHYVPEAVKAGDSFVAHAVFSGSTPLYAVVANRPAWMSVSVVGGLVLMTGTPTGVFDGDVVVTACNCNGTAMASEIVHVVVED